MEDECQFDADCDDDNPCTVVVCRQTDNFKVCDYPPRTCDDGDMCTIDYCDPAIGCWHSPLNPAVVCDDGIACTHDTCDLAQEHGCANTPVDEFCDDGDSDTTDVCDVDIGACVYRDARCPIGTTYALGACWVLGFFSGPSVTPNDCNAVCGSVGLEYAEATRDIAGSDGTDANCQAVLAALGQPDEALDAPSASCASGLGCFVDVLLVNSCPGQGRCATPPTDATSLQSWVLRVCACE
jgi:hypothetical protein